MIRGEEGAYAVSNFGENAPKKIVSGKPANERTAHILPPKVQKQYKFYYTDAKPPVKCGVVFPKSNTEVSFEFDSDIMKYFGVWVNAGDLNDMYTMAIEPCTALYDDPIRAKAANAHSCIKAHDSVDFTLKMFCKSK
jgi:Zn-finger nucleic acid-binding protein